MNILVTGSSGHLGEALMRSLPLKGYNCKGIDIKASPFTHHVGSVADRSWVASVAKDVDVIIHTATLHKPHVATHSKQDFIDTNITGTLNLLEESILQGVKAFIFTSTTSTFGDSMHPAKDQPAVWVTEETIPQSKNIYGQSKLAAEDLCLLFYRNHRLPCLILKTSRFFLEEDDKRMLREKFVDANIKANEFLNRRVELQDAVDAHVLALEKAEDIGFGKYIISATSPFLPSDLKELNQNASAVVSRIYPSFEEIYHRMGWQMFPKIGRVYVNAKARKELGWEPRYDFARVLDCLQEGKSMWSPLAEQVGQKAYHEEDFEDGPYPVEESERRNLLE